MIHRIGKRKFKIYAFDLESHNDIESIEKAETSMWLGCLLDENSKQDDPNSYVYSIEEFVDKLDYLSSPKKRKNHNDTRETKNICIWIYAAGG